MKSFVSAALLCLLLAAPVSGEPVQSPHVCLAGVDAQGNVRIRSFEGSAVMERKGKVVVEVGDKKETREIKIGMRFASEQVLIIGIQALEGSVDGQPLDEAKLRELLAKERPVLVATQNPSPAVRKVIKKGTLLLISPVAPMSYGGMVYN